MTKFVSSTSSSNSDYNAEFDFAYMDIDLQAANQILVRHAIFIEAKSEDSDLWEMYF